MPSVIHSAHVDADVVAMGIPLANDKPVQQATHISTYTSTIACGIAPNAMSAI
jgi:hypothetical protein